MLIQLQYRVPVGVPFNRATLDRWLNCWLFSNDPKALPDGVRIIATDWDGAKPSEVRRWLRETPTWQVDRSHRGAGVVARYARQNKTFCDYDSPKIEEGSFLNVSRVAHCLGISPRWIEYRRTRRGWHLTVCWPRKFSTIERVAIQQALGSDPVRELFNLTRVISGRAEKSNRWNLLFERKVSA